MVVRSLPLLLESNGALGCGSLGRRLGGYECVVRMDAGARHAEHVPIVDDGVGLDLEEWSFVRFDCAFCLLAIIA